jgi:hypothetical protein
VQNKILEGKDDFAAKNGLSARFKCASLTLSLMPNWQLLGMRIKRKWLCQHKHCTKHAMLRFFSQVI